MLISLPFSKTAKQSAGVPPEMPYQNNNAASGGYSITADTGGGYTHTHFTQSSTSLIPLPGCEEADLLKQAIGQRALLHNQIVAMEAAKTALENKTFHRERINLEGNIPIVKNGSHHQNIIRSRRSRWGIRVRP